MWKFIREIQKYFKFITLNCLLVQKFHFHMSQLTTEWTLQLRFLNFRRTALIRTFLHPIHFGLFVMLAICLLHNLAINSVDIKPPFFFFFLILKLFSHEINVYIFPFCINLFLMWTGLQDCSSCCITNVSRWSSNTSRNNWSE